MKSNYHLFWNYQCPSVWYIFCFIRHMRLEGQSENAINWYPSYILNLQNRCNVVVVGQHLSKAEGANYIATKVFQGD